MFLILHGWQNERPDGHWQRWLASALTERGHEVVYPQLPSPHLPVLSDWLSAIADAAGSPEPGVERVVIAHSLSCAAWIHLAERGAAGLPVDRLLFVAPPGPKFLQDTPELRGFAFADGAHRAVASTSLAQPRLVCTSDDPYCDPPADVVYDKVFDTDVPPDAVGHFDMDAGYGEWTSILKWCEDGTTRIGS